MRPVALRAGAAAVCVGAAVILVLLALDARAWSSRLPADDLRYRRDASAPKLWSPHELSPQGVAVEARHIDQCAVEGVATGAGGAGFLAALQVFPSTLQTHEAPQTFAAISCSSTFCITSPTRTNKSSFGMWLLPDR